MPSGRLRGLTQPRLLVDELVLRPWEAADAPAVVRAYADPDIRRWHVRSMSDEEAPAWIASWSRRWQEESGAGWAVCDGDALVGRVGLSTLRLHDGVGAVGYWVLPAARGRGVAPRALQAVSSWVFEHVGLHRLELVHSTRNAGSCRVAVKAGFLAEGTARQEFRHEDGWHDMHRHARLRTDPPGRVVATS